jgi:hypothetical protein
LATLSAAKLVADEGNVVWSFVLYDIDRIKPMYWKKYLSQRYFIFNKSQKDGPRMEPGPPQ